jgi:hypothetical protein
MDTGVLWRGVKWPGPDIDHSPPVLRMSGANHLFSLYAFVAWTRTNSRFIFVISIVYWFTYLILRNQCFNFETIKQFFCLLCVARTHLRAHAHTHIIWTSTTFRNTNIQWLEPATGSYKPQNGCHSRHWVNHCIALLNAGVAQVSEISMCLFSNTVKRRSKVYPVDSKLTGNGARGGGGVGASVITSS